MSLQVWLPLNKDINGRGLCNVPTTSINSASIATGGKLGGCLSLSSDGQAVSLDSYMDVCSTYTRYSMSAWICMSGTATNHSASILSSGNWNSGSGQFCFALYSYSSDGYYKILVPNKARWSDGIDLGSPIKLNTWYNICITYDGSNTRGYVNGEYVGSYAGGGITASSETKNLYVGSATYHNEFTLKGSMNDVRIYDHCLSAKEVKEISKGLICHYKLDNNGFGNPNLITTMSSGGNTTLNGKYGLNADFSQNTDTYGYFNVSPALELDSTYTLSFDVSNFPVGGAWNFMLWINANYDVGTITKDGHYTYTFVPSESKLPGGYSLTKFLFDDGVRTNPSGMVYFTNFKIEKGSVATPWCPHTSDDVYTLLGLDSVTEVDCSGYKNDGNKIGNVLPSSESGRYSTSTYCNSTNVGTNTAEGASFIRCTLTNPIINATTLTINWWGNIEDYSYHNSGILSLSNDPSCPSDYTTSALAQYDSIFRFNLTDGNDSSIDSLTLIETGSWHMYTLVFNNGIVQGYRDGVSLISNSKSGTLAQFTYVYMGINVAGGAYRQTKSKWSDFRIYSTALSDSDIQELYNVPASIDKNGNMYAYEFKEE